MVHVYFLPDYRWLALVALLAVPGLGFAQAPTVTGLLPARNDVAAQANFGANITFSQPMNPSPSSLGSLRLYGEQTGGWRTGSTFGSSNHILFALNANFRAGEQVGVTVTTAAQALNGSFLAKGHVYSYTVATGGTGKGYFSPPEQPDLPVGGPTGGEYVGDLDGDGDPDALIGESTTGTVAVYKNLGTGGLLPVGSITLAPGVSDLRGVDLDGDTDLLAINIPNDTYSTSFNNGNGVFSGGLTVPAASTNLRDLDAADVDGDGDQDMVTWHVGPGANRFLICPNNGSGVFPSASFYALPTPRPTASWPTWTTTATSTW